MNSTTEIDKLRKEEPWRLFRIMGEFVEGFDALPKYVPCVTVFGSSRVPEEHPYYQLSYRVGRELGQRGYTVLTGGGPGTMEAVNRGAYEAGAQSIGLNIWLPHEQVANRYTTESMRFRYFFVRKVMLVKYSTAFFLLPGGFGTLDELFETLTLIQTQKVRPFPVILMGVRFCEGLLNWIRSALVKERMISPEELDIFRSQLDVAGQFSGARGIWVLWDGERYVRQEG